MYTDTKNPTIKLGSKLKKSPSSVGSTWALVDSRLYFKPRLENTALMVAEGSMDIPTQIFLGSVRWTCLRVFLSDFGILDRKSRRNKTHRTRLPHVLNKKHGTVVSPATPDAGFDPQPISP